MTDREHAALEAVSKTIREYDEDTIIEAFRIILDRFNYEVVPRDPGPDEEFWTDEECADPNCACHRLGRHPRRERDIDLMARAFPGQVINMTGKLL